MPQIYTLLNKKITNMKAIQLSLWLSMGFLPFLNVSCHKSDEDDTLRLQTENIIHFYEIKTDYACSLADDAIIYPEPWSNEVSETFTISDTRLKNTSTCGLIQTFFNQPWNRLGPWCSFCSNLSLNGVQYFNDRIDRDTVLNELFSREDAKEKMIGKYLGIIQNINSLSEHPGLLYSFELLLSSEKFYSLLRETDCNDIMLLTLSMIEVKKSSSDFNNETSLSASRHIIAGILLRKNYEPFITACSTNEGLETNLFGYKVCYDNGKVENYAKLYLKR
jgi:hypothetical protein